MTFFSLPVSPRQRSPQASVAARESRLSYQEGREREESIFTRDVASGLSMTPKRLHCKYLYDRWGSELFDRICDLPEYYPTRTELGIMQNSVREIAECIGPDAVLIEFGSGSSLKTRVLLDQLQHPRAYLPVDISRGHLLATAERLRAEHPGLAIRPLVADFSRPVVIPTDLSGANICVYFPGSTIGNLEHPDAVDLLSNIGGLSGKEGGLLIGFDLQKDSDVLTRAYNDSQGVTAAFNLNLLRRINREANGSFVLEQFEHVAVYDTEHNRIEISIESRCDQSVRVGENTFDFVRGERIHTEYSHKYTISGFEELAKSAGWTPRSFWTDPQQWFAVMFLESGHVD